MTEHLRVLLEAEYAKRRIIRAALSRSSASRRNRKTYLPLPHQAWVELVLAAKQGRAAIADLESRIERAGRIEQVVRLMESLGVSDRDLQTR